jgi:uncharacterized protein YcfL
MRPVLLLARFAGLALLVAAPLVGGCKKDDAKAESSTGSTAAASNLPAKGPWEAVKVTWANKNNPDGTPLFTVENTGGKTVKVLFLDFYAYDAKGTQLAKKEVSYNLPIKGGAKDEQVSTSKVPGAVSWDATYHGIEFDGETSPTMNYKRAPDKKPKGK